MSLTNTLPSLTGTRGSKEEAQFDLVHAVASRADRLRNIEETMKRQQDQIDALSQQGTASQSQRHIVEAALDATGSSNRKSSGAPGW